MGNLEAQLEGFAAGALWFYGALVILEALLELREIPTLQGLRARLRALGGDGVLLKRPPGWAPNGEGLTTRQMQADGVLKTGGAPRLGGLRKRLSRKALKGGKGRHGVTP